MGGWLIQHTFAAARQVQCFISMNAKGIHTIVLLEFIIPLPYFFRHLSPPTNFELLKPFNHQNVLLFNDITAITFGFSIYFTFGNIKLFL